VCGWVIVGSVCLCCVCSVCACVVFVSLCGLCLVCVSLCGLCVVCVSVCGWACVRLRVCVCRVCGCCECRVLSGRGLCDELITRPEESYRLCCVVVCDLETSRMGAPYIYDISRLKVNDLTLILLTWRKW